MQSFQNDQLAESVDTEPTGLWAQRKRLGAVVAAALLGEAQRIGDAALAALAWRIAACCDFLTFDRYDVADGPLVRLTDGNFCRARLCPLCQRLRSGKLWRQFVEIVELYVAHYPSDQALLVTLTIRNCSSDELSLQIDQLVRAFRKLTRLKLVLRAWRAWFRTLEVTRNNDTNEFHGHLHALVTVPRRYFQRSAGLYINQAELSALWGKALGVNYTPIVDVRAVEGVGRGRLTEAGRNALLETTKYVVKPSDVVSLEDGTLMMPSSVLLQLHRALHGRRLVGKSTLFRKIARDTKHVDVDAPGIQWGAEDFLPPGTSYVCRERWCWDESQQRFWLFASTAMPKGWREFG